MTTGSTEEVAASVGCAAGATARFAEASCGESAVSPVAGGSWSPIRPCVAMPPAVATAPRAASDSPAVFAARENGWAPVSVTGRPP